MVERAGEVTYANGHIQEGIVIRPEQAQLHPLLGQLSFKVISEEFLLKISQGE